LGQQAAKGAVSSTSEQADDETGEMEVNDSAESEEDDN